MNQLCRVLSIVFWAGGVIASVVALLWRVIPQLRFTHNVEVISLLHFAAVLFLGAIASWAVGQTASR